MAEAHAKHHDYHLVDPSPWPIVGAVSAFVLAIAGISYMHGASILWLIPGFLGIFYTMIAWWGDIIREGSGCRGAQTALPANWRRVSRALAQRATRSRNPRLFAQRSAEPPRYGRT